MRICKRCKQEKLDIDFIICHSKSTGRESIGKTCRKCYDEIRKGRERNIAIGLRKYGWDTHTYDLVLKDQGGICLGCLKKPELDKRLHVDHCHDTNIPRGLLCRECNLGMGLLKDDSEILKRLADYLEKFNAKESGTI